MRWRLIVMLMALVAVMFLVSAAMAAKMLCVSKQELRGEGTVAACVDQGERFAVVDEYGLVRILTPEEIELTKMLNPKAFEARAFGAKFHREAPAIPPLPVSPEQQ